MANIEKFQIGKDSETQSQKYGFMASELTGDAKKYVDDAAKTFHGEITVKSTNTPTIVVSGTELVRLTSVLEEDGWPSVGTKFFVKTKTKNDYELNSVTMLLLSTYTAPIDLALNFSSSGAKRLVRPNDFANGETITIIIETDSKGKKVASVQNKFHADDTYYGRVRLSDMTTWEGTAGNGVAATPYAVAKVNEKANDAQSRVNTLETNTPREVLIFDETDDENFNFPISFFVLGGHGARDRIVHYGKGAFSFNKLPLRNFEQADLNELCTNNNNEVGLCLESGLTYLKTFYPLSYNGRHITKTTSISGSFKFTISLE